MKIKDAVLRRDNNYSKLEKLIKPKFDLTSKNFTRIPSWLNESISIILPSYNVTFSLPKVLESLNSQIYKNFEVIVVDDGSKENLEEVIKNMNVEYNLHFIKNSKNQDRSFARNTGFSIASGESILILDPDMLPNKNHLLNLATRIQYLEDGVIVGFKHHIDPNAFEISSDNIINGYLNPDFKEDWRYKRFYDSTISAPNFLQKKEEYNRDLYILDESDNFKNLGYDKIIGAWDISSLVLGHTICFKKEKAIQAGGFAEEFKGWGHDDIAFAVRMIANESYIIPCTQASSYHINHAPHSGSRKNKLKEFKENLSRFLNYVNQDIKEISFKYHNVKLIKKQKNKFFYEGP